jgi:hypothetical protein
MQMGWSSNMSNTAPDPDISGPALTRHEWQR